MNKKISIIPYPLCVNDKNQILQIKNSTIFINKNDFKNKIIENGFELCKVDYIKLDFSGNSSEINKKNNQIELKLIKEIPENPETDKKIKTEDSKKENQKEAYSLEISEKGIQIKAESENGAFYGIISLCQLLMNQNENPVKELPCCFIYDKPEFLWRGFLLDTCRSFYSVEFIKKLIDAFALHKLNVFHWHLTDDQGWRFNVPEYPELIKTGSKRKDCTMPESEEGLYDFGAEYKGYYTDEEIKEVVNYAQERMITIVPEVEFPGHVSALLASYPEFGCTKGPYQVENRWGIFEDVLCLGNDSIFDVYDKALNKLKELFPSDYIHIGGDECPVSRWKSCPKCQARIKALNLDSENQLQSWATTKIVELVLSKGKIPIGWDEVLENTTKIPLPAQTVVQSWRGNEGGEAAVKLNHKVIMSPVTCCYLNLKNKSTVEEPGRLGTTVLSKAYAYSPKTEKMNKEEAALVLGGEAALWTEKLPFAKISEYMIFPRLCALSECFWKNSADKNFERFCRNLKEHKQRLKQMDFLYYDGKFE